MVVSTCGHGNTGASAVLDFLKGYSHLRVLSDFEFQLVHMPDGLLDLKYHLAISKERIACNAAIQRFEKAVLNGWYGRYMRLRFGDDYVNVTHDFLDKIPSVCWDGASVFDPSDVSNVYHFGCIHYIQTGISRILKVINKDNHFPKYQKRYFSILSENDFNDYAKEYIRKIFNLADINEFNIVADMLISATNPSAGLEFFYDPKVIVVNRDPRDLFVRSIEHKSTNTYFPCDNVESFVKYYKMLMRNSIKSDLALYVQYEDLIYNYYSTTKKIMNYLNLEFRPDNEFKYFNPDISVKYTKAWNTYPGHEDEINYIKKELSEYIYNFPEIYRWLNLH